MVVVRGTIRHGRGGGHTHDNDTTGFEETMNPSRIGTPVFKTIDTWHFKFNTQVIEVNVAMRRPRDAQMICEDGGARTKPDKFFKFVASVDHLKLVKQGLDRKVPSGYTRESHDINMLWVDVEKDVQTWLDVNWTKVIAVGFAGFEEAELAEGIRFNSSNTEGLEFKFCVLEQAGELWREGPGEHIHNSARYASGIYCNGFKVFPYSRELEASLMVLECKFRDLSKAMAHVLFKCEISQFMHLMTKDVMMLPAPGLEKS